MCQKMHCLPVNAPLGSGSRIMRVLISRPIPHPDMPSLLGIAAVKAPPTVFERGERGRPPGRRRKEGVTGGRGRLRRALAVKTVGISLKVVKHGLHLRPSSGVHPNRSLELSFSSTHRASVEEAGGMTFNCVTSNGRAQTKWMSPLLFSLS